MEDPTRLVEQLGELQGRQSLKIIELHDALRPQGAKSAQKRNSNVSDVSNDMEIASPAGLQAELVHYKELFSKLRFSYVEQVTKEKFLRAITDNPPLFVEHQENVALESELAQVKAALKAQKIEVAELVTQLDTRGRELAKRYESIQTRTAQLSSLPSEIRNLEESIERLRAAQEPNSENPSFSLPLPDTQALLVQQEKELASLENQISMLEASIPRKTRELDRLERELEPLETQKRTVVSAAVEARRRRDAGESGMGDELEERGRWLRAVEKALTSMLEVEG